MRNKKVSICFTDTETTGFDSRSESIIQLAALKVEHAGDNPWDLRLVNEFEMKLEIEPEKVSSQAAAVNGYSPEVWATEAVDRRYAMKEYLSLLEWSAFGGQHPSFDYRFIEEELIRQHLSWPRMSTYGLWTVDTLARPLYLTGYIENVKQATLVRFFKMGEQMHDALDDVRQCVAIYRRLLCLTIVGLNKANVEMVVNMEDPEWATVGK